MYSNEDLERFYFKYQTEALPHGQSLQSFCLNNNVPYNIFSKWYKDTRRKVVAVQIDGRPSENCAEKSVQSVRDGNIDTKRFEKNPLSEDKVHCSTVRIWLELRMSNGLYLSRKNLSYQELSSMIDKLEGLC